MTSPLSAERAWPAETRARLHGLTASVRAFADSTGLAPADYANLFTTAFGSLGAQPIEERAGRTPVRLSECLDALARLQGALRDRALGMPFEALRRTSDALARLRRRPDVAEVLAATAEELCAAGEFDRALVSRVRGSTWIPEHLHTRSDADAGFAGWAAGQEIPLTSGILEAELVRRRVAALVLDAQREPRTYRPLVEASRTRAYVVAPIITATSVVGLLHADRRHSGRPLTDFDRDNLQVFADGVGLICEHAALRERLAAQRERLRAAFGASERAMDQLDVEPVMLTRADRPVAARTPARPAPALGRVPDGLTRREREVLGLMSSGATNAQIADQLTVSESTVKSHVKHILRKLGATNRTEAIARCLRTAQAGRAGREAS